MSKKKKSKIKKAKGRGSSASKAGASKAGASSPSNPAGPADADRGRSDGLCRTQAEAARYAGVCVRVIRRWKNERGMPVTAEGWYIKKLLDVWKSQDDGRVGAALAEHRQRDIIAKAGIKEKRQRLLEIEVAVAEGKYILREQVEKEQLRKVVDLTRGLDAMRRKAEARVPAKYRAAVSRILKEEIRHMRQRFSEPWREKKRWK